MTFGARILADSISPDGVRLLTYEITHPRYILAEVNTHKMLSKSSASNRAIPVATMLQRLADDPYMPVYWGANQKGMQADEELPEAQRQLCREEWLAARDSAIKHVKRLHELGLHKQDANRILEPFMWHTAIISGTEWSNFFHLRNHTAAHPAFKTVAAMMQELFEKNEPEKLDYGDWHMPLIDVEDYDVSLANTSSELAHLLSEASVGRCARVSYLTHDGKRDIQADIDLAARLKASGHMSPFEHVARPATTSDSGIAMVRIGDVIEEDDDLGSYRWASPRDQWHGNFRGWVQKRKLIPNEHDMLASR